MVPLNTFSEAMVIDEGAIRYTWCILSYIGFRVYSYMGCVWAMCVLRWLLRSLMGARNWRNNICVACSLSAQSIIRHTYFRGGRARLISVTYHIAGSQIDVGIARNMREEFPRANVKRHCVQVNWVGFWCFLSNRLRFHTIWKCQERINHYLNEFFE